MDPGTLSDFLSGRRWPQPKTRAKIEQALGWEIGSLADMASGIVWQDPPADAILGGADDDEADDDAAEEDDNPVLAAIRADPHLHPVARAHLLQQYQMLLFMPPDAVIPTPSSKAEAAKKRLEAEWDETLDVADRLDPAQPADAERRHSERRRGPVR